MKAKRVFYILEQIDVDGDNIADGFLASQYRIDKYGNKIFLKNKYITFVDLKSRVKSKSKGGATAKLQPNSNDVIIMTKDEYNRFMNQNAYNQQYPNQPYYPNQPNQPYPNQQYQQYPPNVLVNNGNNGNNGSFMSNLGNNMAYGFGAGVGLAAGDALFDGIASFF